VEKDGDLNELHAFAKKLGLNKEWFQDNPKFSVYQMPESKYNEAIKFGAIKLSLKEFCRICNREESVKTKGNK
jgi:hypothetical protein